uniref:HAT C-terminal dimerisation domain-containing protein n=1 Tax=Panagrolaimus sp. ES5 TaxID=591445 RepID=A0AC34FV15_9BILA
MSAKDDSLAYKNGQNVFEKKLQNSVEYPRQQENSQIQTSEVGQFAASQRLRNPNEENLQNNVNNDGAQDFVNPEMEPEEEGEPRPLMEEPANSGETKISTKLSTRLITDCETRWASKVMMVEGWLELKRDDLNLLKEFHLGDTTKTNLIRDLIQMEGDFRSYLLVMKIYKEKILLLESQLKPTTCALDIYKRSKIFKLRGGEEAAKAQEQTQELLIEFIKSAYPEAFNTTATAAVAEDDDEYAMCPGQQQQSIGESIISAAKNELIQYFQYKPNDEEKAVNDVLKFWKLNENRFSYLSKFVKVIFAIPASSASIEREFSVLSRTVTKDRRCLEPSTISDLLLFKSVKKIDFI